VGTFRKKKSVEFKPLNGLQIYLPTGMEYEVNNRGVNCNFPYLIDFDIHSEQQKITHRQISIFCIFSIVQNFKRRDVSEAGSGSVFRRA